MQLELNDLEAGLLRSILENQLGDLRMEIGKTENMEMRNDLKANEAMLKSIIARLGTAHPAAR